MNNAARSSLFICTVFTLTLFTPSSSTFAGGVGPAEIEVDLPTLAVDDPIRLWHVDYGSCVDRIAPWIDLPGFPSSVHEDVYFDLFLSKTFDENSGAHRHTLYRFYRGHYPKSYFDLLRLTTKNSLYTQVPGKTKFIAQPQGTCTFGDKEMLDESILSRWFNFQTSWPTWGIWRNNCQQWASMVVD